MVRSEQPSSDEQTAHSSSAHTIKSASKSRFASSKIVRGAVTAGLLLLPIGAARAIILNTAKPVAPTPQVSTTVSNSDSTSTSDNSQSTSAVTPSPNTLPSDSQSNSTTVETKRVNGVTTTTINGKPVPSNSPQGYSQTIVNPNGTSTVQVQNNQTNNNNSQSFSSTSVMSSSTNSSFGTTQRSGGSTP